MQHDTLVAKREAGLGAPAYPLDAESLHLESDEAARIGETFAQQYQSAEPFHHIAIDNFLPEEVLLKVREEALAMGEKIAQNSSLQEHRKTSYSPDILPHYTRLVFHALNSQSFLKFLEKMTGIDGLIPDPYFQGGGIHRTNNRGYLGIHADFNHHKEMDLERRLNVLIYLNPDWQPEFGGNFEVWTPDMKSQVASFAPIMNRMACFSTSSTSMHGNPEPVNHPDGMPRLSMALYYYTATWSPSHVAHSTLFRPRPTSQDVASAYNHRRQWVRRYTPPVAIGFVERVMDKLKL